MGFEGRFEKKDSGSPVERIKAQTAAYREMRDTITGTDHLSTHMKGLLNVWSTQESRAKKPEDVQRNVSSDMRLLFESTREQLSKEMNTPEGKAESRAALNARAAAFAGIARKHGFSFDPDSI